MSGRTRIKLCGFTREADVKAAVAAGADAIGMIFFAKSPRALTISQARELREHVPAFVNVVALFVNPEPAFVEDVIARVAPDLLQFHGNESPEDCQRYGKRYIRAFRVGAPGLDTREDILDQCRQYASASGWLFDSHSPAFGGSGHGFDHSLLAPVCNAPDARPMILAGGLNADNVGDGIRRLRPFAVDVSSGIEETPGIKSVEKIESFIQAVRANDL